MYVWSKTLAVALVVALWGYGATALQAKDHKDQSCPKPQGICPAPVLQRTRPDRVYLLCYAVSADPL
jgi:hypothetical protein